MTNIKKGQQGNKGPKAKKLHLNKETLKDLSPRRGEQVRGGSMVHCKRVTVRCVTGGC